jgi:hypothetical protein
MTDESINKNTAVITAQKTEETTMKLKQFQPISLVR